MAHLWLVLSPTWSQEVPWGSARTLPPGTYLRFDATDLQLAPTMFGGELSVRHRFLVLGGQLAGRCFEIPDAEGRPPPSLRPMSGTAQ